MKKILSSLSIITIMAVFAVGGSIAYFSDTETSTGNIFQAGTLDLKVEENDPTTWKFVVPDIKPGDEGEAEAEIKNTGTIDGYLHITFKNLLDKENGHIEPEIETANQSQENCEEEGGVWNSENEPPCDLSGDLSGELAENLDLLIYIDEAGGTADEFDLGIDTLIYQGKARGVLQGDIFNYFLASNDIRNFRVEWNLPIAVGNVAQGDKAGFDIVFELTQNKKEIVGNLHFNENSGSVAYDSSGYGNAGAINGAVWTDGKYNPALEFDGVDDYVEISDSDSLDISEEWTIAMWVKWQANSETYQTIFNKENGNIAYSAWIYSDELYFGMSSGGIWYQNSSMGNVPENIWTYVVVRFDGTRAEAYINGVYTDKLEVGGVGDTNDANLYFGRRKGERQEFKGVMDEVKIYPRVLSADEILENYEAGI